MRIPANTRHSPNNVPMLGQRRRRSAKIETVLGECLVFDRMFFFKENKNEMNRALGHLCAHIG